MTLSAVRPHTENLKPPRALHCHFPIGRPLGVPGDAAYQRNVLDAAFALLDESQGPVLVDYPETIEDSAAEPLACSVPPRMNKHDNAAIDEIFALRGAYDRALEANRRTNVGRLADADGLPELMKCFVKIAEGTDWMEAGIPTNNILEATKDIMSYYEEAASAMVDHTPKARQAESWFFEETEGGQLLKDVRGKIKDAGVPYWMYIAPMTVQ